MSKTIKFVSGGALSVWEDRGQACFRCECPLWGDGIYKVWIRGNGEEVLLGTLVPERGRLLLCRSIPVAELERRGCWPVYDARCAMTYSFLNNRTPDGWTWNQCPQNLTDAETQALGQWRGMLCRRGDGYVELAVPLRHNEPLPLSHLFCLAVPRYIRADLCIVWRFNEEGGPIPVYPASE